MSFITSEDRELHQQHKLPPRQSLNPASFHSIDAYLRAVGAVMANYARVSFRHGNSATCQMWVYAPELSNREIQEALTEAVRQHTGDNIAVVKVTTNDTKEDESIVNLALQI
jgi:hypothetical protein